MDGMPSTPVADRVSNSAAVQPPAGRRRKVFYLVDSLNVGGTETQAVELALRLPVSEYEVTMGCLRAEGPLLEKLRGSAVNVREFHPSGGLDSAAGLYELIKLAGYLRREKFDVVHTHDLWSNLMGVPAARLARVPAIVSSRRDLAHFDWYQGKRRHWLRRIQNLSGVVLANATPIRDALISEDRFAPEKLRVIHNGVDTEKFQRAQRDRARLFPDVGNEMLVVLVGNMHSDVKGHPWLIAAAPTVVREFPEVRFVFAGDGELRPTFAAQVAQLGLESTFKFLGRRSDIPEILASCDLAVLPSRAEGLPNAVLEYMAAGLPTIASRVGGMAELIQDGVTGLLVPAEDANALAGALLQFLRDPEQARQIANDGQRFAVENFSFERLIREIDELYGELLERRRGKH
ncbi:MAG: glycosyl transferase family 1 [Acidobacteria bacterium]|nr:MAG: glycosyl transferase family 1 [Acidobacteriota bacterium]